MKICVVHLVWKPLGLPHLERFAASYARLPAQRDHALVVLYNGFESPDELQPYRDALSYVQHQEIVLPGARQDIAAYLEAARRCECDLLCFLNSYSEVLCDNWLGELARHAEREDVGLVGASGSYESHASAVMEAHEHPLVSGGSLLWRARTNLYILRHRPAERRARRSMLERHEPFPNPHLRSNAFVIARGLLLSLDIGDLSTKEGALEFESGRQSMTRQVLARGLQVLVAGRDGRSYSPELWFQSRTFRSGQQQNLLVSDNRTRQFEEASPQDRAMLARMAWGEEAAHAGEWEQVLVEPE